MLLESGFGWEILKQYKFRISTITIGEMIRDFWTFLKGRIDFDAFRKENLNFANTPLMSFVGCEND